MSKYKNVYEIWLMGFESLLQWGIDRFAQANAVGVAETGAEGGSRRLTDEVSIMLTDLFRQRTYSTHARRVSEKRDRRKIISEFT